MYVEAESGIRAKEERREQIQALLADVREGDLVLVDKLDRWSRDAEFILRTARQVHEAGAAFFAISDNCDPGTREGKFMLGVRASVAEDERERIRERLVGTRRLLRDRGYYVEGVPPYGYVRQPEREKRNILAIDRKAAERVRGMFEGVAGGASLADVGAVYGVSAWRVRSIVRSRVYLGEIQNTRGEWIKSFHEAIVGVELWERANAGLLERRTWDQPRGETREWILRDVAVCLRCGAKMGAAWAGQEGARRHYYRCVRGCVAKGPRANTGSYVPRLEVEEAFAPMVVERMAELREELAQEPARAVVAPVAVDHEATRDKLRAKRLRLLERHADGDMNRDELRELLGKVDGDMAKVEAKLGEARRPLPTAKARAAMLREVKSLAVAWRKADGEQRRRMVRLLAHRVAIAKGEAPVPTWKTDDEMVRGVK